MRKTIMDNPETQNPPVEAVQETAIETGVSASETELHYEILDTQEMLERQGNVMDQLRAGIGDRSPDELVALWTGQTLERELVEGDIREAARLAGFENLHQHFSDALETWGRSPEQVVGVDEEGRDVTWGDRLLEIKSRLEIVRDSLPKSDNGVLCDGWVPASEASPAIDLMWVAQDIDETISNLDWLIRSGDEEREEAAIAFNFQCEKLDAIIAPPPEVKSSAEQKESETARKIEIEVEPGITLETLERNFGPEALREFVDLLPSEFQPGVERVRVKADFSSDYGESFSWISSFAGNYLAETRTVQLQADYLDTSSYRTEGLFHESAHGMDLSDGGLVDLQARAEFVRAVADEQPEHSLYASETYARQGLRRGLEEDWADSIKLYFTDPSELEALTPKRAEALDRYMRRRFPDLDVQGVREKVALHQLQDRVAEKIYPGQGTAQ